MADLYAPPHATQADQLWNELRAVKAERDRLRQSAAAWEALVEVIGSVCEQDDTVANPAVEPLLDKILELRDVKAERDEARAQRDRLLAAARRFLALLGDRAIASVQLAGKELDELRRAVR